MSEPVLDPLIEDFYTARYDEDARLRSSAHGRLEFLRTQELLRAHLPPAPARVLDVGGATGVHARWLATEGYRVHLVDPVAAHVAAAASLPGVSAQRGDARRLAIADASVDACLLLGPLYHLPEAADRAAALGEAVRVTRPGGLVVAAAISRYIGLLELAGCGGIDEAVQAQLVTTMATGIHRAEPDGFTNAYFHLPLELADELSAAGLERVEVLGVEGPSTPALDAADLKRWPALMPSALRAARLLESDPALIAASPHLLGIGHLP